MTLDPEERVLNYDGKCRLYQKARFDWRNAQLAFMKAWDQRDEIGLRKAQEKMRSAEYLVISLIELDDNSK